MMMRGRSSNGPCKRVLDKPETLYVGGVEIEKEGIAVIYLKWTMEVAMVEVVLESSMGRMRRRSRMCMK